MNFLTKDALIFEVKIRLFLLINIFSKYFPDFSTEISNCQNKTMYVKNHCFYRGSFSIYRGPIEMNIDIEDRKVGVLSRADATQAGQSLHRPTTTDQRSRSFRAAQYGKNAHFFTFDV